MDKDFWEIPMHDNSFNKNAQHYLLSEGIDNDSRTLQKYLHSVFPLTENIICLFEKIYDKNDMIKMMSLKKVVDKLEPFAIYMNDINYRHLKRIQYFIKNTRKDYLEHLTNKKDEMNKYKNTSFLYCRTKKRYF